MKRLLPILLFLFSGSVWAQLPTVLSVQEALPCTAAAGTTACTAGNPYATGVSRASDNFTVGIPIADSDGVNCGGSQCAVNGIGPNINLRLQNSAGTQLNSQFKVLANWPSGNVKWVLVDGQASPTAVPGSPDTPDTSNILCVPSTTVSGVTCGAGGGNFPAASNLATNNTTTITVNTGVATFTVKKANFDVLDAASIGVKNLLFANSPGIVVMGPVADNVSTSCTSISLCNVAYESSNDANSTAVIEENGPLKAVIKAEGCLINGVECYMRFRARLYFYKNSTNVAIRVALRNADEGGSSTFASAYKGYASYSIQLNAALGPNPAWTFGTDGTPVTGTFTGTESAYLDQAFSTSEEDNTTWKSAPDCPTSGYCIVSPITRTGSGASESYAQSGYSVVYNGANVTGFPKPATSFPQGWGDLTDGSGSGILAGIRYLSAYWPKELKFTSSLLTIGLMPDQTDWLAGGGILNYQVWPDYKLETVYLSFHNGALASEANTFLAQQYQLIAKATGANGLDPITYYNNATGCAGPSCATHIGALLYPLVSATEQNSFWTNAQSLPACAYNTSPPSSTTLPCWPYPSRVWLNSGAVHDFSPVIYHGWNWALSGSGNQSDKQDGFLINRWIERGHTGAYLNATQFFKYEMEDALAHSDVAATGDTACNSFGLDSNGNQIFHWRCASTSYLDANGFPANVTSNNASFGMRNWANEGNGYEHAHWYGLTDYYFLTGDMFAYDTMLQGAYDMFAETRTGSQQGTSLVNVGISRAMGHFLTGAARTYRFAKDVSDPTGEAATIASVIQTFTNTLILTPDFCPSTAQGAWPGRCLISVPTGSKTTGVSRTRGIGGGFQANSAGVDNGGGGDTDCPILNGVTLQPCGKPWMDGIMAMGMWETYQLLGATELNALGISPTLMFDLIDGIGNWADRESFILGPTGTAVDTKLSYDVLLNGVTPMVFPSTRIPSHAYVAGQTSTSPNGSIFWLQQVTTGGTSSSTPNASFVFNATPGGTTTDGTVIWTNEGSIQGSGSSPVAQYEFDYYLLGLYQGSLTTSQKERFLQNYIEWAAQESMNPDLMDDQDMYESSNVIYVLDHPGNQLSSIVLPTSVSPNPCTGVTSCTINWTPPTPPSGQGILSYRLKLDANGRSFTEWIGYEPPNYSTTSPFGFSNTARGCLDPVTNVNSCSGDPAGTSPWFAGTEVTPAPAANANSFVVTGLNPNNTYHFALKATFGTGAPPPPPPANRTITTVQR